MGAKLFRRSRFTLTHGLRETERYWFWVTSISRWSRGQIFCQKLLLHAMKSIGIELFVQSQSVLVEVESERNSIKQAAKAVVWINLDSKEASDWMRKKTESHQTQMLLAKTPIKNILLSLKSRLMFYLLKHLPIHFILSKDSVY